MKNLQIAIDGPAAAGKTTMARMLSESLKITYLDTGRLYRAMAYYYKSKNISEPKDMIAQINQAITIIKDRILLNDEDITDFIYTPEIGEYASICSVIPEVRTKLLNIQRNIANNHDCIMDGRDIGTVIMPQAQVKFYLHASITERAQRRLKQKQQTTNTPLTISDMTIMIKDLHKRDERDMTRETAPLKRADDALFIDTTNMTISNTFQLMYRICDLTKQTMR